MIDVLVIVDALVIMTGDRMKMLMLTLPFMVLDLITPEVIISEYVLVCTRMYYFTFPVPVCTKYVPVRTSSEPVRTKYPIPVMWFTIPDYQKLFGQLEPQASLPCQAESG